MRIWRRRRRTRLALSLVALAAFAAPSQVEADDPPLAVNHVLSLDASGVRNTALTRAPGSFGGTFIEGGKVVALFTGDAGRHMAELKRQMKYPDRLELRMARFTLSELSSTKEAISERRQELSEKGIVMYVLGVREAKNVVRVEVNRLDDAVRREFASYGSRVVLEEGVPPVKSSRRNDPPPFLAGYELFNVSEDLTSYTCTESFAMKTFAPGPRYFVTSAGHCFDNTNVIQHGPYTVGSGFWLDGFYWGSEADVIPIEVTWATTAPWVIDDYPDIIDVVTAMDAQIVGAGKCKSGVTSDRTCGVVVDTLQDVYYASEGVLLRNQVIGSMWNDFGDSGAPVYHHVQSNVSAAADGIVSGIRFNNGVRETIYSDIQAVRRLLNMNVATTVGF